MPAEGKTYDFGLGWWINIVIWECDDQLVGYSMNQTSREKGLSNKTMARIDCCHAHIHEHQKFKHSKREIVANIVLLEQGTALDILRDEFARSEEHMLENYEKHEERWERGY